MTNTINAIKGYINALVNFIAQLLIMLGQDELASKLQENVAL